MKKAILPGILALFTLIAGGGWFATEQKARLDFEDYDAEIDSLQTVIDLRTQELASCNRKLSAKEKGIRFNSETQEYERLEWVTRRFTELTLGVGDTILIHPPH